MRALFNIVCLTILLLCGNANTHTNASHFSDKAKSVLQTSIQSNPITVIADDFDVDEDNPDVEHSQSQAKFLTQIFCFVQTFLEPTFADTETSHLFHSAENPAQNLPIYLSNRVLRI